MPFGDRVPFDVQVSGLTENRTLTVDIDAGGLVRVSAASTDIGLRALVGQAGH